MRSSGYREKIRNHIFLQEMIWRMFHLEQSRRLSCPLYLPRRTLERLYTMSALLPKADIRRRELDVRFVLKADRCTAFPGTVIASCHARKIHNVWHSTSVQPFYLCGDSGRVDMSNCGWNCQLAVVTISQFLTHWLLSWVASWAAMLPVVVLAAPIIRSVSLRLTSGE